jgi:hypothetical protein
MPYIEWEKYIMCSQCGWRTPLPFGDTRFIHIKSCPVCRKDFCKEGWIIQKAHQITFKKAISISYWAGRIRGRHLSRRERIFMWFVFSGLWMMAPARSASIVKDLLEEIRDCLR